MPIDDDATSVRIDREQSEDMASFLSKQLKAGLNPKSVRTKKDKQIQQLFNFVVDQKTVAKGNVKFKRDKNRPNMI